MRFSHRYFRNVRCIHNQVGIREAGPDLSSSSAGPDSFSRLVAVFVRLSGQRRRSSRPAACRRRTARSSPNSDIVPSLHGGVGLASIQVSPIPVSFHSDPKPMAMTDPLPWRATAATGIRVEFHHRLPAGDLARPLHFDRRQLDGRVSLPFQARS